MSDMSLKEIEAWLEVEIAEVDDLLRQALQGRADHVPELQKARARLVAKLADVRIAWATAR